MKTISIVSGCYNEEDNVKELYLKIKQVFSTIEKYSYEHIFIDNCSTDNTVKIIKEIAQKDKNIKLIVNSRNFGPDRSGNYAIRQAKGDAVVIMASDLQDPPELIPQFIEKWEKGAKIILAVNKNSDESKILFKVRKLYYWLIEKISETEQIKNANGFGLYDRKAINAIIAIDDPLPYFRGLICEIGFEKAFIEFVKPIRKKGTSKNNIYSLYSTAMVGITSYSKIPLRIATFFGFIASILSFFSGLFYFIYKLIYWNSFIVGIAPMVIGVFFMLSVQLFFIGIIGEYIGTIHTQVQKRPLIIEKERINFN